MNLAGPEPSMTAQGSNRRDLARTRPTGHGLRVDPEHGGNFSRRQELITLVTDRFGTRRHEPIVPFVHAERGGSRAPGGDGSAKRWSGRGKGNPTAASATKQASAFAIDR